MFILDSEGGRISSKFYDKKNYPGKTEQVALEKKVAQKTKHSNARTECTSLIYFIYILI